MEGKSETMTYNFLFQQALQLHEAGRLNEAEQIYRQILQATPDNPDILNLLGLIAQSKGLDYEAISLFSKAIRQSQNHAPYYFNIAVSYENISKLHEAVEAYNKVLKLSPETKETYHKLGCLYKKLNNLPTAINYFDKALNLDNNYIEPQIEKALLSSTPQTELEKLNKLYPKSAQILYHLSRIFYFNQDNENALYFAQQAYDQAPTEPQYCFNLGLCKEATDNITEAENLYRQAIKNAKKYIDAYNALAALLSRQKRFNEAEALFKEVMNLSPQNIAAGINYADMLYRAGRLQEAVERYHDILPLAPNSPELSNNFGIILKDLGDYEEALGLFFNALSKQKSCDEISINIAETLTLLARKAPKKAQEIAKNWLKSYPNNIFARHFNQEDVDKEYASKLFDNFASTYEKTLNKIKYNIPNELKKILNSPKGLIIDLGCGTGLVAQELKSADNTFIGIDISPSMLKIAETKKLYKELICTDITNWLKKSLPQNTNLIIAADVFCYMKDLSEIIKTCAPYPLCFTIEKSPSGKTELSASGRYQHSPQGINDLLRQNGYADIIQKKINLRQEDQTNVEGLIFFAT